MGVFDAFTADWREGDYRNMESFSIDLTTPDGFQQLAQRAARDALEALGDHYDELVGVSLTQLADDLTEDLMQASVSLPKDAFVDPRQSGRELLVIKHAYRYFIGKSLVSLAQSELAVHMAFPSGQPSQPVQPAPSSVRPVRSERHPSNWPYRKRS